MGKLRNEVSVKSTSENNRCKRLLLMGTPLGLEKIRFLWHKKMIFSDIITKGNGVYAVSIESEKPLHLFKLHKQFMGPNLAAARRMQEAVRNSEGKSALQLTGSTPSFYCLKALEFSEVVSEIKAT